MPNRSQNNRGRNNNNPEGHNQFSNGWMDTARERPVAAAAVAAATVGAGVFLWSKRSQISEQLSNLSEQIGEFAESKSFGSNNREFETADSGNSSSFGASAGTGSRSGSDFGNSAGMASGSSSGLSESSGSRFGSPAPSTSNTPMKGVGDSNATLGTQTAGAGIGGKSGKSGKTGRGRA